MLNFCYKILLKTDNYDYIRSYAPLFLHSKIKILATFQIENRKKYENQYKIHNNAITMKAMFRAKAISDIFMQIITKKVTCHTMTVFKLGNSFSNRLLVDKGCWWYTTLSFYLIPFVKLLKNKHDANHYLIACSHAKINK